MTLQTYEREQFGIQHERLGLRVMTLAVAAALAGGTASAQQAQDQQQGQGQQQGQQQYPAFEELDTDGDGRIGRSELAAVEGLDFANVDTDQNEYVSREEYLAATDQQQAAQDFDVLLEQWDYQNLYENGWRAEQLMEEAEVIGANGEDIGSIENLLINEQGQIVAAIAQVGGFWDIGDTHVAVPWDEIQREGDRVQVPLTEDNADDYSLFDEDYFTQIDVGDIETVDDDVQTGLNIWKATDLLGDYAVLENGAGYGVIDDLIFDMNGMLMSVVVNASPTDFADPGYYAYPWFGYDYPGYAWDPGLGYYTIPYSPADVGDLDPFDYDELNGDLF